MEDVYTKGLCMLSIIDSSLFTDCVGGRDKALLFLFVMYFCDSCIALGSLCVKIKWRNEEEEDCGECYTALSCSFFDEQDSLELSSRKIVYTIAVPNP